MTAANHPTPFTHWFEALIAPLKAAFRQSRLDPVAHTLPASGALNSKHPASRLQKTSEKSDLSNISQETGLLVLPATLPARMLLLSAGKGISTTMSMLNDLQARSYQGDVVLLHVSHNPTELLQAGALQRVADNYPELSLLVHFDDQAGDFCAESLSLAVPDVNERATWLCGPRDFVDMVQTYWCSQGLTVPLHSKSCSTAIDKI